MPEKNRLLAWVQDSPGLRVIPLMGYPGIQITHSSVKQNLFNWGCQIYTLLQLAKRFRPDAVFTFMDLSLEANALGLPVKYPPHERPSVEYAMVKKEEDLLQFMSLDILKDTRTEAIIQTTKLLKLSSEIWVGNYIIGPFTLAGLMMGVEGSALSTLTDPQLMHAVLDFCTRVINRYARVLEMAGADMIGILEPTAKLISPNAFREFSVPYIRRIKESLSVPLILHICGDATPHLSYMVETGVEGLSLDAPVCFPEVVKLIPEDVCLVGNVDPVKVLAHGSPEEVRQSVRKLVESMKEYDNFILSTGCDLPPETPLENIEAFMQAGRKIRS